MTPIIKTLRRVIYQSERYSTPGSVANKLLQRANSFFYSKVFNGLLPNLPFNLAVGCLTSDTKLSSLLREAVCNPFVTAWKK